MHVSASHHKEESPHEQSAAQTTAPSPKFPHVFYHITVPLQSHDNREIPIPHMQAYHTDTSPQGLTTHT